MSVFDSPDALTINEARIVHLDSLDSLGRSLDARSVLDVGCGIGPLAQYFVNRGCRVVCVAGRRQNTAGLRSSYHYLRLTSQMSSTNRLRGSADLMSSFAMAPYTISKVRWPVCATLATVCNDLLLLETVVSDHDQPVSRLLDEPPEALNQAIGPLGCRPSPAFVTMALSRVGFSHIYAPKHPPSHQDFRFEWQHDLQFSRDGTSAAMHLCPFPPPSEQFQILSFTRNSNVG